MPALPLTQRTPGNGHAHTGRQALLRLAVAQLAVALDAGAVTLTIGDLEALAVLCDGYQLPREAARVRRWIA